MSVLLSKLKNNPLLLVYLIIFLIQFTILAIQPYDRQDWLMENLLVFIFIILVFRYQNTYSLSNFSWTLIFIFMVLHETGAHFNYSNVPYDDFLIQHFDFSLNHFLGWERNNFDRIVHFAYGLLITLPYQELIQQNNNGRVRGSYMSSLNIIISTSALYEILEWGVAEIFGGELGIAYLGVQGDVWDAQKDMLLAIIGSCIVIVFALSVSLFKKDGRN